MTDHKTIKKKLYKKTYIIDYFKGLLMTHRLDFFMSGKNLRLNGLLLNSDQTDHLIIELTT